MHLPSNKEIWNMEIYIYIYIYVCVCVCVWYLYLYLYIYSTGKEKRTLEEAKLSKITKVWELQEWSESLVVSPGESDHNRKVE